MFRLRLFALAGAAGLLVAVFVATIEYRAAFFTAPVTTDGPPLYTEKKVFELPAYTTVNGKTIKNVRVGWESYGTLNAERSNVILVLHPLIASSHAAGKYSPEDPAAGWWDIYIGPGKAIDTNRFFVISIDTLANMRPNAADVVTTGPSSIDPETGKPYGTRFPVVTMRDFVEVQRLLLESLGIKRLYAVAGPSMGAMQAYEWAAAYPDRVDRLLAIIGSGIPHPWLIALLDLWASPVKLDPKWNGGDYYGREPPYDGLKLALKISVLSGNQWPWLSGMGRELGPPHAPAATAIDARFRVEQFIDDIASSVAQAIDPNHFLYTIKAMQAFQPGGDPDGLKKIKAKTLIIYAKGDQIFIPEWMEMTAEKIRSGGAKVETVAFAHSFGHSVDFRESVMMAGRIRDFIER